MAVVVQTAADKLAAANARIATISAQLTAKNKALQDATARLQHSNFLQSSYQAALSGRNMPHAAGETVSEPPAFVAFLLSLFRR